MPNYRSLNRVIIEGAFQIRKERRIGMTDSELDRYMRLYYSNVYGTALCCCRNPSDAYDIAQEIFLKLYTYAGSFNDDEHVKAWLLRCAINKSTDMLRSHWNRNSRPLEAASGKSYDPFAGHSGSGLARFMKKISKKNRIALYLHYYEGYSVTEIAEITGVTEVAVRSRLLRGKNKLKKLLENERG